MLTTASRRRTPFARRISICCAFQAVLAGLFAIALTDRGATAAVVFEITAYNPNNANLTAPFSIGIDSLGNFYVVDQGRHRVVKFGPDGAPKLAMGSYGFGNGQLYYPQGVTVGTGFNGQTLIYVADTANSRVVFFNTAGKYLGKFGDTAPGGLNNPGGIAFLKHPAASGGLVIVADTRNHRVAIFSERGEFQTVFTCGGCPAGGIRPLGVAARYLANGALEIYAVDELTSQVQVLTNSGVWKRSIGSKGTGKGQFQAPHGIAADEDGNVYVADSGFAAGSTERITKFGPGGNSLYSFNTTGGTTFMQPHGVAVDEQGKIYVANSGGGDVYRFREEAAKLTAFTLGATHYWVRTKGIWFSVLYNGVEQTCRAGGSATVTAPAGGSKAFTIDGGPIVIGRDSERDLKMDMTTQQTSLVDRTWDQGKKVGITAKFQARCQDGKLLQKSLTVTR